MSKDRNDRELSYKDIFNYHKIDLLKFDYANYFICYVFDLYSFKLKFLFLV
jgi:hypothetical protein